MLCCRKTGAPLCTVMVKLLKGEFYPRAPRMHEATVLSFQREEKPSGHVVIRGNAEAQPVFMQTLHLISAPLIKACSVALERQKRPSECLGGNMSPYRTWHSRFLDRYRWIQLKAAFVLGMSKPRKENVRPYHRTVIVDQFGLAKQS